MKYPDARIKNTILDFIADTDQSELRYIIPFCLGYYEVITPQIWRVITDLIKSGVISK